MELKSGSESWRTCSCVTAEGGVASTFALTRDLAPMLTAFGLCKQAAHTTCVCHYDYEC
jgi:hypothetical protein